MADENEEFYNEVGSERRSGRSGRIHGDHAEIAAAPNQLHGLNNPGTVVNSDMAEGEARWSEGDGVFWRARKTHEILPAGLYTCAYIDGIGAALRKQELKTDDLLVLPEKNSEKIFREFDRFWTLEDRFKLFGFLYKRGFLLYGPPGSGKTSLINLMMKTIIERYRGIIVVIENPNIASDCLSMIRKNEPTRPLITIMEDLDALVEDYGEAGYLNLLDGSEQINNVIHIGTTNYPRRLDKRFVDRPSRFDTVVEIGMPGWDAREAYFRIKFQDKKIDWWTDQELEKWTRLSEGLSVAHMREMIISVVGYEQSVEYVIKRLRRMHEIKLPEDNSMTSNKSRVGFIGASFDEFEDDE